MSASTAAGSSLDEFLQVLMLIFVSGCRGVYIFASIAAIFQFPHFSFVDFGIITVCLPNFNVLECVAGFCLIFVVMKCTFGEIKKHPAKGEYCEHLHSRQTEVKFVIVHLSYQTLQSEMSSPSFQVVFRIVLRLGLG